jgi:hypothetical protein
MLSGGAPQNAILYTLVKRGYSSRSSSFSRILHERSHRESQGRGCVRARARPSQGAIASGFPRVRDVVGCHAHALTSQSISRSKSHSIEVSPIHQGRVTRRAYLNTSLAAGVPCSFCPPNNSSSRSENVFSPLACGALIKRLRNPM